jgi:hypothetical protein
LFCLHPKRFETGFAAERAWQLGRLLDLLVLARSEVAT